MRHHPRKHVVATAAIVGAMACSLLLPLPAARAITVTLDYTYDTLGFFGSGNPSGTTAGLQAKASLEAAASYFSGILNDTFLPIEKPEDLESEQFTGEAYWNWTISFTHPTTGANQPITNPTIAADEYRIYAGARDLLGTTLGRGGPGGHGWSATNNGGGFSSGEIAQIQATTASFSDAVDNRGDPSTQFARWGGVVAFDSVDTVWHYDHTTPVAEDSNDFYSVAIHELAHALGFGASNAPEWIALAGGATFSGLAAKAANNNVAPPLEPPSPTIRSHWRSLPVLMSQIHGTTIAQEVAMDPELTEGTRKHFTNLDAAALTDIGWEVSSPSSTFDEADFNQDTFVNGGDLAIWESSFGANAGANADGDNDSDGNDFLIWQRHLGSPTIAPVPEPSAVGLALAGAGWLVLARRRTRQAASIGRM